MELRNDFRVGVPPQTAWLALNDVERIAPCMPGAQLQEIEGDQYRGVVKVKVGPITAQYKGKAIFVEQDETAGRMVLRASGRDTGGGGNANATITATLVPDGDGTRVIVVTELAVTGKLAQFGRGVLAEVSTKLLGQFADCLERNVLAAGGVAAAPVEPPASEPAVALVSSVSIDAAPDARDDLPEARDDAPAPANETSGAAPEPAANSAAPANGVNGANAAAPPQAPASTVRRVAGREVPPVDLLEAAGSSLAKRALAPLAALVALLLALQAWRRWHDR